jgi:hypothetical protein
LNGNDMRTLVSRTESTSKSGAPFFKARGNNGYFGTQTPDEKFVQKKPVTDKNTSSIQMKPEEEEPLQTKQNSGKDIQLAKEEYEPVQNKGNEEDEPVQKQGKEEEEPVQKQEEDKEAAQMKSSEEGNSTMFGEGTSSTMPEQVQTKMENSFGTNFSNVTIQQNDGRATQLGALAFTQGNDVHFAPGQYNPNSGKGQELLGHELTHVVQQRQGKVSSTKQAKGVSINDNPSLENEADVMGKKAAFGERNIITQGRGKGFIANNVSQCYTPKNVASQSAKEWNVGEDIRVADNGFTVTKESNGKLCYAHPYLIGQSNLELKTKNSGVELVEGSKTLVGSAPDGTGKRTLKDVTPKMSFSKKGAGSLQTSWEDCGRMSREVMGKSGSDESPHGLYNDKSGNLQETAKTSSPEEHRNNIFVALGLGATPAAALAAYNAKPAADKKAFDKMHGLNEYASPSIGEAFATNNAKTFNFHWGGVVLKTGGDSVTLENFYKGHDYDSQDSNWYFQTYGPASKPGQTFDEQWNSTTGGDTFTTRTSTRSIVGKTNAAGVRLVDKPSNWDDKAHYDLLAINTQVEKISTNISDWSKVKVLSGGFKGKTGYIMNNYFEGA